MSDTCGTERVPPFQGSRYCTIETQACATLRPGLSTFAPLALTATIMRPAPHRRALQPGDDGDGMPRAREIANGLSDSNAADANGDPDYDGFTNRQEYLAGTNPHDANSYLKVGQFNVIQNANGNTAVSTISWIPVAGRLYAVERSSDLTTWQVVADNIEATPPLNSVADTATPPNGKVFYRVVAK